MDHRSAYHGHDGQNVLKALRFIDSTTHRGFAVQILRSRKIEGVGRDERLQERRSKGGSSQLG